MDTIEVPNYPGNSRQDWLPEDKPKPKTEAVTKAKVVRPDKKKGIIEHLLEDMPGLIGLFTYDIFVPAAKNLISEIVHSTSDAVRRGVDEGLYGNGGGRGYDTVRDHGRSYISYDKMSSKRSAAYDYRRDRRDSRPSSVSGGDSRPSSVSGGGRRKQSPDDVIFSSRMEAENVLSNLIGMIADYGEATVGDMYDLSGITSESFTDRKWGWRSLGSAYVDRGPYGYYLKLPEPQAL